MEIDFFSYKSAPADLKKEWQLAISEVIDSGQFIGGAAVSDFENNWSQYLGIRHAIGVGNGYDALVIALKALEIGPGDFVAVPSHTFIATWLAVDAVGATPIGIDCDASGLMDLNLLDSENTLFSAVIPVHMHGQMIDMQQVMNWARKNNTKVIEDCAQAHGASIHGKKSGTWGDIGAFSFYPTKNLGAIGDAGALVTDNDDLANRMRSIANYGKANGQKYQYEHLGINSRLDPIQAAVLNVNIKYLDSWNTARKIVADKYTKALSELGIQLFPQSKESVFHHYIALSENRDITKELLGENGVKTEIHYSESAEVIYNKLNNNSQIKSPRANKLSNKTISLPLSPWITDFEINYVLDQISSENIRRSFLGDI
jgi:dTDP-4-amino-4,6-dideoxygalactose transaminase